MAIKRVQETRYGLYVWITDDGRIVADEDGNYMLIQSKEHDSVRIQKLRQAARAFGVPNGKPVFMPGARPVSDEEYQRQRARLEAGLIPDDYDAAAWAEEARNKLG